MAEGKLRNGNRPSPQFGKDWPGQRCTARSKRSGQRCKNPAVTGDLVCRMHGAFSIAARHQAAEERRERREAWKALRKAGRFPGVSGHLDAYFREATARWLKSNETNDAVAYAGHCQTDTSLARAFTSPPPPRGRLVKEMDRTRGAHVANA